MTTTVEVSGAAPLVETTTASVGTVIGEQQVVDLPLNLRRYGALALLVTGTVPENGGFGNQQAFSETAYGANGARTASNNFLIDGVDSRELSVGGFGLQPPPDAVQEFKIQTNIYSAAFGKAAGSTINLVVKSGTNELHGSVYEFLRNDKLDARNFFAINQTDPFTAREIPGSARPEFRRNQFGFALGGPIRKNKTFWFANYEGLRFVKGLTLGSFVPTDNQKAGNFSGALTGKIINLCGAGGPANLDFDSGQLFDPASEAPLTCPPGSANAGSTILVGQPIMGNIIKNIDPVAQKVLAGWPEPNRPGFPNFLNQNPKTRFDHQFLMRLDHTFSEKDQIYAHYMLGQTSQKDPSTGYTTLPTFGDTFTNRGQNVALGWTHTLGARLLNEARLGFQRNMDFTNCEKCPRPSGFMAGLGINNFQAISPNEEGFPFFGFSNFAGVGDADYRPVTDPDMVEKYFDNLTWTHGRHTVLAGADLQFWQVLGRTASFSPHGQFFYNGQFSSLGGEIPDASGVSDLADFLLGYPNNAARHVSSYHVGGRLWNFYVQDDFKLSPSFSLNLGLRYEYRRNAVDKQNNLVVFRPLAPKFSGPGNGVLVTAADDTLNDSFCTDASYSYLMSSDGRCLVATSAQRRQLGFTGRTRRTLVIPYNRNWAPRFGLTWRPTHSERLIVRTGYGIFIDMPNFNNQHFVDNNPVFSPSQIYDTAFGAPPPLTNGQPTTTENVFAGAAGIPPLIQQFASLFVSPNYRYPYVQEWSFGLESQLAQSWALEADYIGTKGTHLGNLHLFANQPEPGVGDLQPRRPYPDFNIMLFTSPDSNSIYNSLQAKLTKKFSSGFTFLVAYTWAHSLDDNEGDEGFSGGVGNAAPQDDNNLRADRGRAYTDVRQRLVFSTIWQLPIGNGKRFLSRGGWVNQIVGDWEISGITTFQSGFPISILSGQDFSNTGTQNARPDRTCNGAGKKTIDSWFDTGCFTTMALEQGLANGNPRFGNSGRNILDGPGLNNWDFALLKNFAISERFKLQFRSEFYNLFNFAHFGSPNAVIGSPNLAAVGSAGEPRDIQFGLKLVF